MASGASVRNQDASSGRISLCVAVRPDRPSFPKAVYPELYDPRTLLLCLHKSCDSAAAQLAETLFSFTNPMDSTSGTSRCHPHPRYSISGPAQTAAFSSM
ncbi:hypothetical protein [Sphingobium sp. YBL2]|uniref:hypothetical protein n=1 Tax=Sphingobium sp. (strain YBL2) TaxID=484429 RepID=UPI00155DA8F7|nr:hypothetical protein [Sphingobium sp. YBL2]